MKSQPVPSVSEQLVAPPAEYRPWQRQVDGVPPEPLNPEDIQPLPYFGVDTPQLREILANHSNSIMRLDSLVGDLLADLDASGKADNTVVLFVSDHGPDLIRGKRTVYEGGVRVPFIVRWPGQVAPGSVSKELVSMVDLFPTFLELSGAEPGRLDFDPIQEGILLSLSAQPEAEIVLRVSLAMPPFLLQEMPDSIAMARTPSGDIPWEETGTMVGTFSSEDWRRAQAHLLKEVLDFVGSQPYADRVIGVVLTSGGTE